MFSPPDTTASDRPALIADRTALSSADRTLVSLLVVSTFVVILNETVMSLALPRLMQDLHVSASTGQWLTTGFLLTMAVVIPTTGFVMERYPLRRVYAGAMALFSLGTAIAATAPGFELLLTGRIVQAAGTGVMMPLLMTTAMIIVPTGARGRIMGVISVVISVAPAIGPTISGLVLARLSWRWLFGIVLPVALLMLALGAWKIRNVSTPRRVRLDILSLALSAVGFGGLIYGLSSLGEASGEAPVAPWVPTAAGALALVLFAWRQHALQTSHGPLLDLSAFAYRTFTLNTFVMIAGFTGLFGTLILLPIYLQNVVGISAFEAGLMLLPGGAAVSVLSPLVGRLYDRYGPRPLVLPGAIVLSAGMWLLSSIGPTTALPLVVLYYTVLTSGLGLLFTPLITSALGVLPAGLYGHGSAIMGSLNQLAGAAGSALFITVLSTTGAARLAAGASPLAATSDGIRQAFFWGAVISVFGILFAASAYRKVPDPAR
ncbi:DHA2 family efflux MFS transporter permease subunit [Actinoplanes sp. TRM 88003]|uniref:DHA2 family efflux MFS transporter permease subunit n=1 Tax=Paractinoplanes aksuensis TaxID=2939490 RepID=A0ABT1E4E4_9ACTN|nr:MDR family MFS transporter [Actinoplanes aksuensis]MCO8277998.1 DHA2 family efflux MFS transporter permease subunit [Actinoplanes aksuensis]